MSAIGDDSPLIHHNNSRDKVEERPVQHMADNEYGSTGCELLQDFVNRFFTGGIDG